MWTYDDSRAAVRDALRLSRAMTYKSAVAGLPLGGGKGVVVVPPGAGAPAGEARRDVLLDFADAVERLGGAYVTAEDVGTSTDDMRVIAQGTRHVTGLPREEGGSGDPSPWTALGVVSAIRAALEQVAGSPELDGRTVAVQGLGHVGLRVAELLARDGAQLVVSDIDDARRADAERLGAAWAAPDEILATEADVVAPCALGGALDHESVPRLRCRAVAGAANNQLAGDAVAELLQARGILWAPDFVANAGGIINISVELEPGGYDEARAAERVAGIGETLREVFGMASGGDVTPLTAAMELARRRLAPA